MEHRTKYENRVLLTGVTGFVGKVVLEELLRRREELNLDRIYILIRQNTKKGGEPKDRFENEVAKSPCFSELPGNWKECIRVVAGDLTLPMFGLNDDDQKHLMENITHFINCAASVEFTLPVAEAALSNITTSLNALEFAKTIPNLKKMVHVSTAYVATHSSEAKFEQIVALPRPAEDIYQDIVSGLVTGEELMAETGHPNTYTLTKCVAEHLLTARKAHVPLIFLRPSIVSACWRYPRKGWIDSLAAFAGFVSLIGSGQLRTLVARRENLLDMVPCDVVADRIIYCAFKIELQSPTKIEIRHAVGGIENNCSIQQCVDTIVSYYSKHQIYRDPGLVYIGSNNRRFRFLEWYHQRRPLALMRAWLAVTGQARKRKFVQKLAYKLKYLNSSFPYFTTRTFDFRSSLPMKEEGFYPVEYIRSVCEGVYRNILKMDPACVVLGGRKQKSFGSDVLWSLKKPKGNWAIRLTAMIVRKAMRRCLELVTFDQQSFENAVSQMEPRSLPVIIPTHRSYADFILCSYLFFAHPELGIAIPHIAAAEEFSRIPVLGWLFRKMQAFYIKRGVGRESQDLTEQVHDLVHKKQTLEFFIEGTRSRSRQMLVPRRGLLKCLQSTRQRCTVLPISISYDRVPEELAFLKELRGQAKPHMNLRSVLKWFAKILVGQVQLGRVHMSCGQPLEILPDSDIAHLALAVNSQLQQGLVTTTHHLQGFLSHQSNTNITLAWLRCAVERRGGKVLDSELFDKTSMTREIEMTTRYHWSHLFVADALKRFPNHPALQKFAAKNLYFQQSLPIFAEEMKNTMLDELIFRLFKPVCDDYAAVAKELASCDRIPAPVEWVQKQTQYFLPHVQELYEDLLARNILEINESGDYLWGRNKSDLAGLAAQYTWSQLTDLKLAVAS